MSGYTVEMRRPVPRSMDEWGPDCVRCGEPEYRIDGYCTIECREFDEAERQVADLRAKLQEEKAKRGEVERLCWPENKRLRAKLHAAEQERDEAQRLLDEYKQHSFDDVQDLGEAEALLTTYREALERIAEPTEEVPIVIRVVWDLQAIAREALSASCDGSRDCQATTHIEGCFASNPNSPEE